MKLPNFDDWRNGEHWSENKVIYKLMLSKYVNNKKLHFLTPPHYTNLQNSMISFDYSWFLAKNFSNFVSLPWKLQKRCCHNLAPRYGGSTYRGASLDEIFFTCCDPCIARWIERIHITVVEGI